MKNLTSLNLILALALLFTASPTLAEHHEGEAANVADIAEFALPLTERQEKRLKRKADARVKRAKDKGVYKRHKMVSLNVDALTRRDPMPVRKSESDVDASHAFSMTLSPFDGETLQLRNTENFVGDTSSKPEIWRGEILDESDKVVGKYQLLYTLNTWAMSYFAFTEGDTTTDLYTFYPLKGETTGVMIHKEVPQEAE